MKHENGYILITDENGNVIRKIKIKDYIDEIMSNDHHLTSEIRKAVIFG